MRIAHKEKAQARLQALKLEMFDHLGHACTCCGEADKSFLTLEHLSGGGGKHRRRISNGISFYQSISKEGWPKDKYTILCMNCNYAKYHNGGLFCPHQAVRIKYKNPIPFVVDKIDLASGLLTIRCADYPAVGAM